MKATIVFVLGLGIGMVAGWLAADPAPAPSTSAPDVQAPAPPDSDEPRNDDFGARPLEPGPATQDFRSALAAALRLAPAAETERGKGRIHGRVTLGDGTPLSGVAIEARPVEAPEFVKPDGEAGDVESWIRARRWRTASTAKTYTDQEGRYSLEGLREVQHRLKASGSGLRFVAAGGRQAIVPDREMDWTATRLTGVEVEVVDLEGKLLDSVGIQTHTPGQGPLFSFNLHRWTRSDPIIELVPGRTSLEIQPIQGAMTGYKAAKQFVTVVEGESPRKVRLVARKVVGLIVRVSAPEGQKVPERWLQVRARKLKAGEAPDPAALLALPSRHHYSSSNREPVVSGLELGRYHVGISEHGKILGSVVLPVEHAGTVAEIQLAEVSTSDAIVLFAAGPGGEPMAGLSFDFVLEATTGLKTETVTGSFKVLKEIEGRYWVSSALLDDRRDARGSITINTEAPSGLMGRVESAWPVRTALAIKWEQAGQLKIHVPGIASHPLRDALSIKFRSSLGVRTRSVQLASADEQEQVVLSGLRPGEGTLMFGGKHQAFPGGSSNWSYEVEELTLHGGMQSASFRLPPFARLTLFSPQGTALPARIKFARLGELGVARNFISLNVGGDKGEITTGLLPCGRYRLSTGKAQEGNLTVDLSGDQRVMWKPRAPNCMRVTVTASDGALAKAGFRTGDLIIGFAGKEFSKALAVEAAFGQMAFGEGQTQVLIIRGGQRIEHAVDFAELRKSMRNPGGKFLPAVH